MNKKTFATFALSTIVTVAIGALAISGNGGKLLNRPVFSTGSHEASRSLTITAADISNAIGAGNSGNLTVGGLTWHVSKASVSGGVATISGGVLYNTVMAGATKTADNWVGSGFTRIDVYGYDSKTGASCQLFDEKDSMVRAIGMGATTGNPYSASFDAEARPITKVYLAFGAGDGTSFTSITYTYGCEVATPRISLSAESGTVAVGSTVSLTATTKYTEELSPTYSYSSSDTNVATVSGEGLSATVTGVAAGSARITVTMTISETPYTSYVDITVTADTLYMEWNKTAGGPLYIQGAGMIVAVDYTSIGYTNNADANTQISNVTVSVTGKAGVSKDIFQHPGFADADGLYITFPDADFSTITKISVSMPHKTTGLTHTAVMEVTFSGSTPTITTLNGVAYATYMAA